LIILKTYAFDCGHHEVKLINGAKHIFENRKNIIFIMCFGTAKGGRCLIRTFKKANIENLINGPGGINEYLNSHLTKSLARDRIYYTVL
jgi:hypothetical protein